MAQSMLSMNLTTTTTMYQQNQLQPPTASSQQPPVPQVPPGLSLFASNSFGSATSQPGNVNLQLQQAAPLTSSSYHIPSPRQGGEKRERNGRLSIDSVHSAPPMMPQYQQHDDTPNSHESSSKKRRSAQYVAPRVVPTTFTSVTSGSGPGLKRNLSFSRIDPYVSYAQTPSLMPNNGSSDMDMDSNNQNHSSSSNNAAGDQSRVRSMSF